jgi:adenylyltransferase/sulfurtransferase
MQALEAIKWILGIGTSTVGRLVLIDALSLRQREIAVQRDPACVVCGERPTLTELIDYDAFCGISLVTADGAGEISAAALSAALGRPNPPLLLDVRESWEFDIGHLPGSVLVPLGELPGRLSEIPAERELVTICHHGMRSATARDLLRRAGYAHVISLAGGVDAWACDVDGSMARY